jgi:phosphate transport system permease protein
MLGSVISSGLGAFWQTHLRLEIEFDPAVIDPTGGRDRAHLADADYAALVRAALVRRFPQAQSRQERRELVAMISVGAAYDLRAMMLADAGLIGGKREMWLLADDTIDAVNKNVVHRDLPAAVRQISDRQLAWFEELEKSDQVSLRFNSRFFMVGDSREAELAGVWGAVVGSFISLFVTLALALPIGVAAAIYLEEFAPPSRFTQLIEVNINNLAAVPSIVFGLLGLTVILGFLGLPRSAALAGGMVLALMTLPTIIIAARAALQAVPPWIREGALALGASRHQTVWHHVLPLAMPGILTGAIIGMARALGETAPLLMIGMVAFVVDVPTGPLSPATALPVQIFMWADSPERAFVEKTAAAIMVLLLFLGVMNALAVYLRKRFEHKW